MGLRICHRVPAGPCCSSPHRRAFLIANSRRRARLAAWGVEYVSVCPLVAAVLRLAGVHFLSRIPAGVIVSPLETENMSPYARWPLPLLASPACIFHRDSPPTWSFRRLGSRICLRVPVGPCCSSPHRRAFFILFPHRHVRLAVGDGEYAAVCPLVAAVARLTGVHFSSRIPAGMIVSPLGT